MTPYSPNYRRFAPPPLPDPSTLPFPGNLIRLCHDCGLRETCTAPVPGFGPAPAQVLFCGEGPGAEEDSWGYKPFVGKAGKQLDSLLMQCGLNRESVYLTNTVHCRPPGNRKPKPEEIESCRRWLSLELGIVQPRIVVALGAPAIHWFLGGVDSVEHLHGKPIEKDGRIILPCYHPAAPMHGDTSLLRFLYDDFQVLRGLLHDRPVSDFLVADEYPNPVYRVADTSELVQKMLSEAREAGEDAVDTETTHHDTKLWSMQVSSIPGTAWFVPFANGKRLLPMAGPERVDLTGWPHTTVHFYLHDIKQLLIEDGNFTDSMVLAYLLGLPQGLKELASRLCGIQMKSYSEVVRPGQRKLSIQYLTEAASHEWPDPPPIEEAKWDNKAGRVVVKVKHPWHISRKIKNLLAECVDGADIDPLEKWNNIDEAERLVVESVLGSMPESSLADIKFEGAVDYACRDAMATLRVKQKMDKLIDEAGLSLVRYMDLGILPMVNEMMREGFPLDSTHLTKLSNEFTTRMAAKAEELAQMVGHPFNPSSSLQVAEVVYGELGFTPTAFTPSKAISTDDMELKKVKHPVASGIIAYRRLSKLKGTYTLSLVKQASKDPAGGLRLHTTLKTTRVETGRLSSSEPNLQNIPARSKDGKSVRAAFVSAPGKMLAESDYCLVPGTRILTEDWRWVSIESLRPGDRVIGIEENSNGQGGPRRYRPTEVVRVGSRITDCYELGLEDGAKITCSAMHPWLSRGPQESGKTRSIRGLHSFTWEWKKTEDIRVGHVLAKMVTPWEEDHSWDAGFLAGAFDGEGSLGLCRGNILSFTQNNNALLSKVMELTASRGYKFHKPNPHVSGFTGESKAFTTWICNSNDIIRFLGTTRSPRLLAKSLGMMNGKQPNTTPVRVTSVTPVGRRRVVSLETTTHTFVAEGFFTHNSQIEMVCLAHLSRCNRLIELFLRGGDPHTEMASHIFGVPMDQAKLDKYRYPMKRVNFGVAYLIGPKGLSNQIQEYVADLIMEGTPPDIEPWDEPTCEKFLNEWYKLNPEVKDFQLEMAAFARRYGYVQDLFGRRRFIPEVMSPLKEIQEAGVRQAANLPVTATAQGIIKLAMCELWEKRPQTEWAEHVTYIMQIHDSLIDQITDDEAIWRPYLQWKQSIMTGGVKLLVPVKVDTKMGHRWSELEKVGL